jgi:SAM-dependent methyltransferase
MDYRRLIYEQYATRFQDATGAFDPIAAARFGAAYAHYLRGWLPAARSARILEVACGSGYLLASLRKQGYRAVSGVDISPEQVGLAGQAGLDVVQADVLEYLRPIRERYDLVIGIDIIEHFRKDEVLEFLGLCRQALTSGGRIILQTPNAESPWGTQHRYNDFTHEVGFNPNALTRLLKLTGFSDVEIREAGPPPFGYSLLSAVRFIVWRTIRLGLLVWNLAETGQAGSGVLTRVFLISAVRG